MKLCRHCNVKTAYLSSQSPDEDLIHPTRFQSFGHSLTSPDLVSQPLFCFDHHVIGLGLVRVCRTVSYNEQGSQLTHTKLGWSFSASMAHSKARSYSFDSKELLASHEGDIAARRLILTLVITGEIFDFGRCSTSASQ